MLKEVARPAVMTEAPQKRFVTISQLARETGVDYDVIYAYIKRFNRNNSKNPIKLWKLPTTGRTRHLKKEDADMIRAVFTNPEDYAEQVPEKK